MDYFQIGRRVHAFNVEFSQSRRVNDVRCDEMAVPSKSLPLRRAWKRNEGRISIATAITVVTMVTTKRQSWIAISCAQDPKGSCECLTLGTAQGRLWDGRRYTEASLTKNPGWVCPDFPVDEPTGFRLLCSTSSLPMLLVSW